MHIDNYTCVSLAWPAGATIRTSTARRACRARVTRVCGTPGTAQQLPGCLLTAYYQPITSQNRNRVLLLRHSWSLLTAYYCLLAY